MTVYDELKNALKVMNAGHSFEGSPPRATWPIGEGRVTTEEFESWQLGPDLTHPQKTKPSRRRRS